MKNTTCLIALAFAVAAQAAAADKLSIRWQQLAYYLEGHQVTVTNGEREYKGKCVAVNHDGLMFEDPKGGRPLRLERAKVKHVKVTDAGGRQMTRLVNRTAPALNYGRKMLFSQGMPIGLVVTPAVAAYFVVSTPFCLLGDFGALFKPALEIDIQDGPAPLVK